jgi:polyisoprenoid-binding protein YceI
MTTAEPTQQALPTGTWNADPVHSTLGFSIDYMAGTFYATFSKFEARLVDGTLHGTADVASIQVKDLTLEGHLQSPEFFDVERHSQLEFEAREITGSDSEVTIVGDITIKGHTEPIELRGTSTEPMGDQFGGERFGLRLEATVDRTKFGLNWNLPLPTGEPALANDVRISADLQFVKEG